ncbi:MAG: D-alanine--D-alanine ligase family protein [Pontimonas sp.]
MADSPHVLILSGGISHERDISLKSGRRVADGLLSHDVSVEIRDPDGSLIEHLNEAPPSVVWPVLHGASGEDGALRALLQMLGIPYVGSTADASRIAWNKPVAKSLVERAGVITPRSITLSRDAFRELGAESVLETVTETIDVPLIVKPAQGGSAQGVSWVDSPEDLRKAMVHAFTYSDVALIEQRIIGVEVCVPIIDTGDGPRAIPAVEIEPISGHYDFEARYTAGATRFYTPPRLEEGVQKTVSDLALAVFDALGLRDLARVDFMIDSDNTAWFLEASTMPGLTETSSTALALDSAGYDVGGVYAALVDSARARA